MNTIETMPRHTARAAHVRSVTPTETMMLVLILAVLFVVASVSGRAPSEGLATQSLRVRPGQTLWSIASEHPTPGRTTAETVQVLAELNDLDSAAVVAGDLLEVPADGTSVHGDVAWR